MLRQRNSSILKLFDLDCAYEEKLSATRAYIARKIVFVHHDLTEESFREHRDKEYL